MTKPLRQLDTNKYMDTSAGGSVDGFSTRNTTAASTPLQASPLGQNIQAKLAPSGNLPFSKNKLTKNYSQANGKFTRFVSILFYLVLLFQVDYWGVSTTVFLLLLTIVFYLLVYFIFLLKI